MEPTEPLVLRSITGRLANFHPVMLFITALMMLLPVLAWCKSEPLTLDLIEVPAFLLLLTTAGIAAAHITAIVDSQAKMVTVRKTLLPFLTRTRSLKDGSAVMIQTIELASRQSRINAYCICLLDKSGDESLVLMQLRRLARAQAITQEIVARTGIRVVA